MTAYLILSDGTTFEGEAIGDISDSIGEVVFTTGMTGYQETVTDPSYYGQIVALTYPLIGNYGVNEQDRESAAPCVKGIVVKELCDTPSNWRSEGTFRDYLIRHGVTGIEKVDTRALTRKLRDAGTMNGIITTKKPDEKALKAVKDYRITYPVASVGVSSEEYQFGETRIAVLNYGQKRHILENLRARGCFVKVFPHSASAKDILGFKPDGILLTNGPGDPKENPKELAVIKELLGTKPMFGICLGHQLLALAHGGDTVKLKFGHRGANHPVRDIKSGRIYITSQNHGYAVDAASVKAVGEEIYVNGNDGTNEGISYTGGMTRGVQFHPEACPGPNDTAFLFDEFVLAAKNGKFEERR